MKKGFTGIELMIVISIISLISAIALPKFVSIRSESKIANVSGNLANLNTSISMRVGLPEIKKKLFLVSNRYMPCVCSMLSYMYGAVVAR
jgi:prepilin-type N-terminal cleavage/methylation domain-containing protein